MFEDVSRGSGAGSAGECEALGDEVGVEREALLHERRRGAQVDVRRPGAGLGVRREEGPPQVEVTQRSEGWSARRCVAMATPDVE